MYCCYDIPRNSTNDTHHHCTWCNRWQSIKLILSGLLKDRCRQHSRMQLEVGLVELAVASDLIMHAWTDSVEGQTPSYVRMYVSVHSTSSTSLAWLQEQHSG